MLTFITIVLLVILVIGHEFGHFIAAKMSGVKVNEFGVGFPPRLIAKKWGETLYSFNALLLGGFVKVHGETDETAKEHPERSFINQPFWKKAWIILAGVLMNILIGWMAFSTVLYIGVQGGVVISGIAEDSPAAIAGLQEGEVLEGFETADEFIAFIDQNIGQEISLNDKTMVPRENPPSGEGAIGVVVVDTNFKAQGLLDSIVLGFQNTFLTLGAIFVAFWGLIWGAITGDFSSVSQISGPVGVFNAVRQAGELGPVYLTQLMGLISLNLAVLNLIPFPALDGGRLLFITLRKFFGEKIFSQKTEAIVNITGFALLILLMIVVTVKDIGSL